MRGDMRLNHGGNVIQRDSSSSSSSPHSSSGHDDEILEVTSEGYISKPIYNFSIPDMIKHEPRIERQENLERLDDDLAVVSSRKRSHASRHLNNMSNNTSVIVRNKRRRKTAVHAAENITAENDGDDDCHRPPVIDLTEIDSQDECQNGNESHIHDSGTVGLRHLNTIEEPGPFSDVWSDLEIFQQHFEDSRFLFGTSSLQHLQRLRRHNARLRAESHETSRDDMLIRTPETITVSTPELTSADDSVTVINEVVRSSRNDLEDDHSLAMRMANDPNFSPPYHSDTETTPVSHRSMSRITRNDESFHQFQERIRSIRQRNRDRIEQARRISQQAHERLARIHDSINSLRHGRPSHAADRSNTENENRNNEVNENRENSDNNTDDVEITHEWNPRNLDYLQAPVNLLSPMSPLQHSTVNRRQLPMPILRPLMNTFFNPLPPPRLHHLHNIQEDYEALLNLAERIGPAKPRGLNKLEIDLIPSFRFSSSTAKETNAKCVVCLNEYSNREKLRRLPCSHDFHSKCIDKWLRSCRTCPICRNELKQSSE